MDLEKTTSLDAEVLIAPPPMFSDANFRARLPWLLLAATLLVHHPALWIDHLLWDEISFDKMAAEGDLSGKFTAALDQRIPAVYYFYALAAHFPDPTRALRIGNLLGLWLTAMLLARILLEFGHVRRGSALAAGLLVVCYPAYQLYANAGASIYVVCLALFTLATYWFLRGLRAGSATRWWLLPAAAAWLASFLMQSLFVYFYAVLAAVGLFAWNDGRWRERPDRAQLLRICALLTLVPPLNYYLFNSLFELHPYFGTASAGYNVPHFAPLRLLGTIGESLSTTVIAPLIGCLRNPVALATGAAALLAGWLLSRRPALPSAPEDPAAGTGQARRRALLLMAIGAGLLAAALLPYAAVGKPPQSAGVQTRFAILVAPALGVGLCGLLELLRHPQSRRVAFAFCAMAFAGFAWQHGWAYANWQICAIKDHACITALRRLSPPHNIGMFLIKGRNLEHTYRREFYDWGHLFHAAWGGHDRIGMPEDRLTPPRFHYQTPLGVSRDHVANFAVWMGYGNPDLADASATIVLESSPDFDISQDDVWPTVLRDLSCRLGMGPMARETWLAQFITAARIEPPRPFAYNSQRLPHQPLLQTDPPRWQDTVNRPLISAAGSAHPIAVYAQKDGIFSILPAGDQGFLLRCDGMETGPGREAELALRVDVGPAPAGEPARTWGVALKLVRIPTGTSPRLVLVLADGTEIEGAWRSGDNDSLEVWTNPDNSSTPVCAWFIWRPKELDARLHCASVRSGWIGLD